MLLELSRPGPGFGVQSGLPADHDLPDSLCLSLRLRLSHEVHSGADTADVVRARLQGHHLAAAPSHFRRFKDLEPHTRQLDLHAVLHGVVRQLDAREH